jgi:hypothetical protein
MLTDRLRRRGEVDRHEVRLSAHQKRYAQRAGHPKQGWKLVPDAKHESVTSGFGEWKKADYATAALAADGSCGLVHLPSRRTLNVEVSKLSAAVLASWFDPSCAALKAVDGSPFENQGNRAFAPLGSNAAGDSDWVLVLQTEASRAAHHAP